MNVIVVVVVVFVYPARGLSISECALKSRWCEHWIKSINALFSNCITLLTKIDFRAKILHSYIQNHKNGIVPMFSWAQHTVPCLVHCFDIPVATGNNYSFRFEMRWNYLKWKYFFVNVSCIQANARKKNEQLTNKRSFSNGLAQMIHSKTNQKWNIKQIQLLHRARHRKVFFSARKTQLKKQQQIIIDFL